MLATTYYEGELTFDGVIDYLGDILGSDTLRKRFIAVTMQLIKNVIIFLFLGFSQVKSRKIKILALCEY